MFLEIEHLIMKFGGLTAINDVSFSVKQGDIHGLIGPNGSGKSTTLNILSGYYKPSSGNITFAGKAISGLSAHQITAAGFARTFQNLRLFRSMTVLDNVLVGMGHQAKTNLWSAIFNPVVIQREENAFIDKALSLLDLLGISGLADKQATDLPYGNQRQVEMARALATNPKILLLDEPAAGLNEVETDKLREILLKIRGTGVTICLVEHDMKLVMAVCDTITVLDYGTKIAEGTGAIIRNNPAVIKAYLGQEQDA